MEFFKSWTEVGSIIGTIALGIMVVVIPYFIKRLNELRVGQKTKAISLVDSKSDYWAIHSSIHEKLTELRISCNATRTQLAQFHNGGYFLDGVSMMKFSITHESVSRGFFGEAMSLKDVAISLFLPRIMLVLKNDPVVHLVTELPSSYCRQRFENIGVKAFSVVPINSQTQNTIGFVIVQWSDFDFEHHQENISKYYEQTMAAKRDIEVELINQRQLQLKKE
jgi:hypothetical protein